MIETARLILRPFCEVDESDLYVTNEPTRQRKALLQNNKSE